MTTQTHRLWVQAKSTKTKLKAEVSHDAVKRTITLRGAIGDEISYETVTTALNGIEGDGPISIDIATLGGFIDEAVQIATAIRDDDRETTIRATGLVASAGTIILAAGDKRTAVPNASIMVHAANLTVIANLNPANLDEFKAEVEKVLNAGTEQLRATYKAVGVADETINEWLSGEDVYLTPEEALQAGLLTGIESSTGSVSEDALKAISKALAARRAE